MSGPVVYDKDGKPMFIGDYAECVVSHYTSLRKGERRRIQFIENGCMVLTNDRSPIGTSLYGPRNFRRVSQHAKQHKENNMLHVALRVYAHENYETMAQRLTAVGRGHSPNNMINEVMADTSPSALKQRVTDRIRLHPEERWLIVAGNTLAENAAPPVEFRQW